MPRNTHVKIKNVRKGFGFVFVDARMVSATEARATAYIDSVAPQNLIGPVSAVFRAVDDNIAGWIADTVPDHDRGNHAALCFARWVSVHLSK